MAARLAGTAATSNSRTDRDQPTYTFTTSLLLLAHIRFASTPNHRVLRKHCVRSRLSCKRSKVRVLLL